MVLATSSFCDDHQAISVLLSVYQTDPFTSSAATAEEPILYVELIYFWHVFRFIAATIFALF